MKYVSVTGVFSVASSCFVPLNMHQKSSHSCTVMSSEYRREMSHRENVLSSSGRAAVSQCQGIHPEKDMLSMAKRLASTKHSEKLSGREKKQHTQTWEAETHTRRNIQCCVAKKKKKMHASKHTRSHTCTHAKKLRTLCR